MSELRFSLRLNNDLTTSELVQLCQIAERAGFDQVWVSHDLFIRSAPVMVTAAALATERLRLGIGIMNPYSVHPAEIAMTAATLQEVSGGRFLLGLAAGAEEFLGWAGIQRPRPLHHTRAAVADIRTLLNGGSPADVRSSLSGQLPDDTASTQTWLPQAYLRMPAAPTPIYVGGMSPRMLGLAGELADGVLPLLYPPEHFATAAEQVTAGIAKAGRDASEVDIAACIWVSIDSDGDRARTALAEKIAYYGASFAPYLLQRAGLSLADFEPIQRALHDDGLSAAVALITPQMLQLGIAGDAGEVVARCAGLLDAGATHLSFGPPLGPDLLPAVEQLGDLLPTLRSLHAVRTSA